jgi:hypothetical protein
MRLQVYGTFLLSGEMVPLREAMKRALTERAVRTLARCAKEIVQAHVIVFDSIGPRGAMRKLCHIAARTCDGDRLDVEGVGVGVSEAVERALSRVPKDLLESDWDAHAAARARRRVG